MRIAREARLKRFEDQKSSYADIMKQAAGGWNPDDDDNVAEGEGEWETSGGLRHRAHHQGD